VAPPQVAEVERILYERYPTVTVINFSEVIDRIQQVVDQIAVVVRFLALFAIVAGVIILASSVASTRFRRIREVVILKTLGATRTRIVRIFSTEFLVMGAVAGFMGSILATLFSHFILKRFLDARFTVDVWAALVTILLTAGLAAIAGWLASFRILGQKPLQVLREE
jgi:putative ABC transport system permease protein